MLSGISRRVSIRKCTIGAKRSTLDGGFCHDERFATLDDVVNHYDTFLTLGLNAAQKHDLVEYLKSL